MDKSYYSTWELDFESESDVLQFCKTAFGILISLSQISEGPCFKNVNMSNSSGQFVAPVELLVMKTSILVTAHP